MIQTRLLTGPPDRLQNNINNWYDGINQIKDAEILDVQMCKHGNYDVVVMITYEDGTGGPLKYRKPVQRPIPYTDPNDLETSRGE